MSKSDMRARRDSMDRILCEVNGKAPGWEAASGEKRASQSSTADGTACSASCKKSVLQATTTTTSNVRRPSRSTTTSQQCRDSAISDDASLM